MGNNACAIGEITLSSTLDSGLDWGVSLDFDCSRMWQIVAKFIIFMFNM
jgi:hypothetical protein